MEVCGMESEISKVLLENKAVTLNVKEPYTFISGIRSPIYCDIRLMAGAVEDRQVIIRAFVDVLKGLDFDVVAGTSTAGIPWASWVSAEMKKPMCYIREEKKGHGKGKQVEGADIKGRKIVVIEDLISTGGSSFGTVASARDSGAEVVALVAIFTYGFEKSRKLFEEGRCRAITLTDFTNIVSVAKDMDYLGAKELGIVQEWNRAPAEWGPKHGFPNAEPK
jgi:orotate phosphoribosyltransferase